MSLQCIHATSQYPTHFLTAKHILLQSGSILSCIHLDNGEQQFLLEVNRFESISCVTSNPTHKLLAIAIQSGNASRLEVYTISSTTTETTDVDVDVDNPDSGSLSLQLKYTFVECCVVGYSHLCISSDAQFIIAVSNIPALEIELWDIANNPRKLSSTTAPADDLRFVAFSPSCNELFITATARTVVVWRIYFKFDRYFLTSTVHSPPPQQPQQSDAKQISSLTFGADGTQFLYLNERNGICVVDESGTLQLQHTFDVPVHVHANDSDSDSQSRAQHVFYTRYYYIVVHARPGLIQFFNREQLQLVCAKTLTFNVAHCVLNPVNYREIVVLDDTHAVHLVSIDKVLLLNHTLQRIENDELIQTRRVSQFLRVQNAPHHRYPQVVALQCADHVLVNTGSQLQLLRPVSCSNADDDVSVLATNLAGVCCLRVHHYNHGVDLVALGFDDGHLGVCVCVASQSSTPALKLFFLERLFSCRLTQIEFDVDGTLIACMSSEANAVWFVRLTQNEMPTILGFYKLPQAPLCGCWVYDAYDNLKLILSFKDGYVMAYDAPEPTANEDAAADGAADGDGEEDKEAFALDAYFVECEVDFSLLKIVRDPNTGSPDRLICITEDNKLRAFFLDDDATIFPDEVFVFDEHAKITTDIAIYSDLLLTAGRDGQLLVRYLADASEVVLDLYAHQTCATTTSAGGGGGVASVTFVNSGAVIVSVGYDGAVLSWRVNEDLLYEDDADDSTTVFACECPLSAEFLATLTAVAHAADAPNELTFAQQKSKRKTVGDTAAAAAEIEPIASEIQTEIADLQHTYDAIVHKVQNGSELRRLDDAELIVDNAEHETLASANQRAIDRVREETRCANIGKQLVSRRIKEQCWDAMKDHVQVVQGLRSHDSVTAFPILAETEPAVNFGVRLQFLRTMNSMEREWCMKTNDRVKHECDAAHALSDTNVDYVWDVNECHDPAAAVAPSSSKDDATEAKTINEHGSRVTFPISATLNALMYHPLRLYTNFSKRTQMHLLNQRIRETKTAFNVQVKALHQTKTGQVERINEMALEMKDIQKELEIGAAAAGGDMAGGDMAGDIFVARCDDAEDERHMFVVREHEMQNVAVRRETAEHKTDHASQATAADHANVTTRALQDMMHNTLEQKDEVERLEDTLKRPEFMDTIDASQWTDAQKSEIEKYEAKKDTLLKAKEVRTKLLRTRLKSLKNDVADMIKNFDARLKELYNLRLGVMQDVYVHELMRIHLANDMVEYERCRDKLRTMRHELMRLREDQQKADATYQEFDGKLEEAKKKLDDLHAAEKYLERAFKKEMGGGHNNAALSSDYFEYLYKLFRGKKAVPPKHGNMGKLGSTALDRKMSAVSSTTGDSNSDVVSMRRSASKQSTTMSRRRSMSMSRSSMKGAPDSHSEATDEQFAGMDLNNPLPADILLHDLKEDEFEEDEQEIMQRREDEIIDPYFVAPASDLKATSTLLALQNLTKPIDLSWQVWSKFLEFRKLKMGKEQEIENMSEQIQSMQTEINALRANQGIIAESIQEIERGQRALREAAEAYKLDCELFFYCRRGCVEVRQCPIVTDYRQSVLIDRGVIEELNGVILKAGREQIEQLHEIKKFRRGINMLNWRAKVLDLEHRYFSLLTTEYQLRRVTKKDQEVIKGGGHDSTQKTQVSSLERKLEFTKNTMQAKIHEKKKQFNKFAAEGEKIRKSNEDLVTEIERLGSDVRDKENITEIRGNVGVQEQKKETLQKRMDAVVTRRKLTDLVAAQTEEIQFLRNELDRLRQKTFPSFSIVDTDSHI